MKSLFTRKTILTLFLTILFALSTATLSAECAPKRIGISQFETNNFYVALPGGGSYDIGLGATDMLTTELSKNKNFEIIERNQIRSVLKEQAFELSGAVDPSSATKMGQLLGLKYLVYGKIISAGAEDKSTELMGVRVNKLSVKVQIAVRMIDTTTGVVVWADQVEGKVEKNGIKVERIGGTKTAVTASVYDEALQKAIVQIANHISQQSPTEGTIVKIIGKKIFLDIGAEQSVQPGQTFKVYREGEAITNAAGQIIGVDKTDICTIKIIQVDGNMSTAEIVDKKPQPIQQGDKVHSI
ncbi:MAG: Curli production assembly/transport component CsgG [Firmicutes bacterium]|nr:Curli production assembly/transport component CsgG [Bacillota bacterium]